MRRRPFAECRTVNVVLTGEEGTQRFHLGLLQTCQFADLQDPVPLQFLCSGLILGVAQVQTVRKPLSGQLGDKGAFTDTLGTVQHKHGVKFAAGIQHTLDGGAEGFPGDGTDIFVVVGTEVVDEQRVHTGNLVPLRQIFNELPNGMVGAVVRDLRHGDVIVSCRKGAVVGIHIADELGIVCIPPEFRGMPPGHIALDLHAVQKLIEHQRFQKRIIHEDHGEVLQRVFHLAGLVQLQGFLPVLVGEFFACLGFALLGKDRFDFLVLEGKIRHCLERRQLAGCGIRGALIVQVTKTMQAHQVKGIQKSTADRICGMVAVCEFAIVDDDTGRRIGGDIVVASVHRRRRIHFREKGIDGFLHGIGSAESTHHTRLCQRVGLLGDTVLHHLGLAAGNRPGGGVVPIIVVGKVLIRVKLCTVLHLVEKLAVRGGGRPVHEPGCLVSGIVK